MSDSAHQPSASDDQATIADVVRNLAPMGDLGRFVIDDLTAEEEDEFFQALADA